MDTRSVLVATALIIGQVLAPHTSYAYTPGTTPMIYCKACSTQTDFTNWIKGHAPGQPNGIVFDVLVANPNTNVIYDVTIQWNYSLPMGGEYVKVISSALATQDVVSAFKFWYPYFAFDLAKFHLTAPSGGYGVESFGQSDLASICTFFAGTSDWAAMNAEVMQPTGSGLLSAFEALMGRTPEGVLIYNNGDVATFSLKPGTGGAGACAYKKGSARNAAGQFINDRILSGNGVSDNSGYVVSLPDYQFNVHLESYTLTCAYIQDASGARTLIGCHISIN